MILRSNHEGSMTEKSLWRGILIVVLCMALATPATAGTLDNNARNIVIGVVAAAAGVVVIAVLVVHYSTKKRAITGCVNSAGSGMTIADEKDRQVYALSGNTAGVKAGDRMKLQGKKVKTKGTGEIPIWETTEIKKDLGVCRT
jgi:hypothetical protein